MRTTSVADILKYGWERVGGCSNRHAPAYILHYHAGTPIRRPEMTTIRTSEVTCGMCGAASRHSALNSSGEYGVPDLDQRPSEMLRSTMRMWLQECPACGLVAPNLQKGGEGDRALVNSAEYRAARSNRRVPPLARRFLCRAVIEAGYNRHEGAFRQALNAAWVCDDARKNRAARTCRLKAAAYLDGRWATLEEIRKMQLVDVLRRGRRWAEADALMNSLVLKKLDEAEIRPGLVTLQWLLIGRRDDARYSLKDVFQPDPPPPPSIVRRLTMWLGM